MGRAVLMLEEDTVGLVCGAALLLLLLLLLLGLVVLLTVLRVLVMWVVLVVASKGAQTGQARRVGLRSRRESWLRIGILGVLRGGVVAVHQSVGLCDLVLVRSIELLRGKGRLLLSGHGVDGRTHGLPVVTIRDGGGTPALGRLCDGGQRALSRRISSFRHAGSASALARAWLGLRRASGST